MNLQDILDPIRKGMEWTFQLLLEGSPEPAVAINWMIIAIGGIGFAIWMKKQGDYNKKAQQDRTIA